MFAVVPFHCIGIIARQNSARDNLARIHDDEIGAPAMFAARDHVKDFSCPNPQASLFEAFPFGCAARVFAGVHKASRQGPRSLERFIGPADEEDSTLLFKQDCDCNFRVCEMDPTAIGARGAISPKLNGLDKAGPTPQAVSSTALAQVSHRRYSESILTP